MEQRNYESDFQDQFETDLCPGTNYDQEVAAPANASEWATHGQYESRTSDWTHHHSEGQQIGSSNFYMGMQHYHDGELSTFTLPSVGIVSPDPDMVSPPGLYAPGLRFAAPHSWSPSTGLPYNCITPPAWPDNSTEGASDHQPRSLYATAIVPDVRKGCTSFLELPFAPGSTHDLAGGTVEPVELESFRVSKTRRRSPASSDGGSNWVNSTQESYVRRQNQFSRADNATGKPTKGRKGSLGPETRNRALQVRKVGACVDCRRKKVSCEAMQDSCGKCIAKGLLCCRPLQFIEANLPSSIRGHFLPESVIRFWDETVERLSLERQFDVELCLGGGFRSILRLENAKVFIPTPSARGMTHVHVTKTLDEVHLEYKPSLPITIQLETDKQREKMKALLKKYVADLSTEHGPWERLMVQYSSAHTTLPLEVIQIICGYVRAKEGTQESEDVKEALRVLTLQHILSSHLCVSTTTAKYLEDHGVLEPDSGSVTSRLLNRFIKALIDEELEDAVRGVYSKFWTLLTPRSTKWFPAVAIVLILCIFMEAVETTAHRVFITDNLGLPTGLVTEVITRSQVSQVTESLDYIPDKVGTRLFHDTYRNFNPIVQPTLLEDSSLSAPERSFVAGLTDLIKRYDCDGWPSEDLHIATGGADGAISHDPASNYAGKRVSKFVLSLKSHAA